MFGRIRFCSSAIREKQGVRKTRDVYKRQGLGISILPELVLRKTNYQVAILPTRPVVMRKIGLVMKDKNTMPIASKYFIEFLFQHINQLP